MGWRSEFGEKWKPPQAILDLVREGVAEDLSWGNDSMPSFGVLAQRQDEDGELVEDRQLRLWSDHRDPAQREAGRGAPRYLLTYEHHRRGEGAAWTSETVEQRDLLATDNVHDAVDAYRRARRRYRLGARPGETPADRHRREVPAAPAAPLRAVLASLWRPRRSR